MSEHVWCQENIAAYIAGGLEPAEMERLEKHLAECSSCTRMVEETQMLEAKLTPLFHAANPGPELEDRIVQSLPSEPLPRSPFRRSGIYKAILAAAAVLLLAGLGFSVGGLMEKGTLRMANAVQNEREVAQNDSRYPLSVPNVTYGRQKEIMPTSIHLLPKTEQEPLLNLKSADELVKDLRDTTSDQIPSKHSAVWKEETKKDEAKIDPTSKTPVAPMEPNRGTNSPAPPISGLQGPQSNVASIGNGGGGMMGMGGFPGGGPVAPVSPGKIQFAPVFANPTMQWAIPDSILSKNGQLPQLKNEFFKPSDDVARLGDAENKGKGSDPKAKETAERDESPTKDPARESSKPQEPAQKSQQTEPSQPTPTVRRIIIRTGELEFEIDSYDASVATILRLITSVKGAFVATINSEKLPNGKVRGSVVVRVPPEYLDNFVLDLRKELGKMGELKNQRIGSQDITKQYTDMESRLKAARTMEDRLLNIIKDGKGQIKDLLQAEKELGVWRTQIEELEGELRYYSNLASLSTLTIKLAEKDIRTAALITESERIQAGIEVEDVEKAHQDALKAILEAKGRVTRSELKQHTAGQLNAILHFEVAPEAAGVLRDRLKQLGNMVRLQVDRMQQTEDGSQAAKDGKIKHGDTQFQLSIYNLANIAPRETVIVRIAATDVPAIYQKLREVIAKAKGHVINAQLDEKDRQNINGQLDFDVRRAGEAEVLAALALTGETLSRQVSRVPETENVTDAKVLYRVSLIDTDSIQPRETIVMRIAAADVPVAYQKLREALTKAKARVINAQLNEQDRRNINATLDFTFGRAEEAILQAALAGAGETLTRQVSRLQESPNVTDAKVLAKVELIHADALPPRETVTLTLAATDVPAAYQNLRDTVTRAKGRIENAQLNEQDRLRITGKISFDIPRAEEDALKKVLEDAGETLSRQVARQQENNSVTDTKVGFVVELTPAAAIVPREITKLAMEVDNVQKILSEFTEQVKKVQGRTVDKKEGKDAGGQEIVMVVFDVPLSASSDLAERFKSAGQVRRRDFTPNPQAPEGKLALGRIEITLSNHPLLVPSDQGLWSQLQNSLGVSIRGLLISASWLIAGLLFVLPWAILTAVLWFAWRLWRPGTIASTQVSNPPQG